MNRQKLPLLHRLFSAGLSFVITLTFSIPVHAQEGLALNGVAASPMPVSVAVTAAPVENPAFILSKKPANGDAPFVPVMIKGIKLFPDDPLRVDFFIDTGTSKLPDVVLEKEFSRLISYFLAALTVPDDDLWVNLSPYEEDRVIPEEFSRTGMGADLLAQDYLLKQVTSAFLSPEGESGKKFWDRIREKTAELYGEKDIPVEVFNKVWIVPEKAVVHESADGAFVTESTLQVMLEEDYLSTTEPGNPSTPKKSLAGDQGSRGTGALTKEIMRAIIIPEIEKEVNEGEIFAPLRQVYNAVILAAWFKRNFKETFLGKAYIDQNKVGGIDTADALIKDKIYQQYVDAFKAGAYDFIKEDYDPVSNEIIPRQYFSGGLKLDPDGAYTEEPSANEPVKVTVDGAMLSASVKLSPEKKPPDDQGRSSSESSETDEYLQSVKEKAIAAVLAMSTGEKTTRSSWTEKLLSLAAPYVIDDFPTLYYDQIQEAEQVKRVLLLMIRVDLVGAVYFSIPVDAEEMDKWEGELRRIKPFILGREDRKEIDDLLELVGFVRKWLGFFGSEADATFHIDHLIKHGFLRDTFTTTAEKALNSFFDILLRGSIPPDFDETPYNELLWFLNESASNEKQTEFFQIRSEFIRSFIAVKDAVISSKNFSASLQHLRRNSFFNFFVFWSDDLKERTEKFDKKLLKEKVIAINSDGMTEGELDEIDPNIREIKEGIQNIRKAIPHTVDKASVLDILLGEGNEKVSEEFFKLASLLRLSFSYEGTFTDSRPPLKYALEEGIYFSIGPDLYITPVTEAFRRPMIFSKNADGSIKFAFEIVISGEQFSKLYTGARNRYDVSLELKKTYPDKEYGVQPIYFRKFPKYAFTFYGRRRLPFLVKPLEVIAFDYQYDGKRLNNVSSEMIAVWANELGISQKDVELMIAEQVVEEVVAMHAMGYVGNGENRYFKGVLSYDQHIENFRCIFDPADRLKPVKILYVGDFVYFEKVDSPERRKNDVLSIAGGICHNIHGLRDLFKILTVEDIYALFKEKYAEFGIAEKYPEGLAASSTVNDNEVLTEPDSDADENSDNPDAEGDQKGAANFDEQDGVEILTEQTDADIPHANKNDAVPDGVLNGGTADSAEKGGIDLTAGRLGLEVKGNKGQPAQPFCRKGSCVDMESMDISGFVPVILRVSVADLQGIPGSH
ncbi:MAG: hypothetical protein AB1650_09385 [Candidatus Omnitrophota bacterium]